MPFQEAVIAGPEFSARVEPSGKYAFTLELEGRPRLRTGRAGCAAFSELSALPKSFRRHASSDGLSASVEARSVIPFGCEYEVRREIELWDGCGTLTVDIAAVNHGAVGDLSLGEVSFPGPWTKLEFLLWGEKKFRAVELLAGEEREFHHSPEIPVMIRLSDGAGCVVEFAAGSDLWRHRAGFRTPGATGEFTLTGSAEEVRFSRQILRYEPEVEPEKRPWRFSSLIAWRTGNDPEPEPEGERVDLAAAELPDSGRRVPAEGEGAAALPCLASPAGRKFIRNLVRRASGSLVLTGAAPELCLDAAHLGRAGKGELEHFDLEDYFAFHLWGNHQLAGRGDSFTMLPAPECRFAGSAAVKNLGRAPRKLFPAEE